MSLTLRKKADGSLDVLGKVPNEHTLPTGFIARHLGEAVDVQLTLKTSSGVVHFELVGFEGTDPSKPVSETNLPNWTAWQLKQTKRKAAK